MRYTAVSKPAPPLIPATADAVSVMPLPVVAAGVSVVVVTFSSRYGPSRQSTVEIDHDVSLLRVILRGA